MFKFKQHVISTSHRTKRAVRISLMLPLMHSKHDYLYNHHKQCKDAAAADDNTVNNHNYSTDSNKKLQIFKLKEKYI